MDAVNGIDVTNPNWYASLIIGLFTKGEWTILAHALGYTFLTTYGLKILGALFIKDGHALPPKVVRAMAVLAGILAGYTTWPENAIAMTWWQAGIGLGPASIIVHHVLMAIASNPPVRNLAPWLYPLLKGRESRKEQVSLPEGQIDRRRK